MIKCSHCGMYQKKNDPIDYTKHPYYSVCDTCTYPNTLYDTSRPKKKEVFRY